MFRIYGKNKLHFLNSGVDIERRDLSAFIIYVNASIIIIIVPIIFSSLHHHFELVVMLCSLFLELFSFVYGLLTLFFLHLFWVLV